MDNVITIILVVILIVIGVLALAFGVMLLWNWLMPAIFGLATITLWQALGLMALINLLIGGSYVRKS
jgi:hypothetical protein